MNKFVLAILILLPIQSYAQDETLTVETTLDNWIHYDRNIIKGSFSTVTPIGYFELETSKENGDGKIFSELNIGGFGRVSQNPWKKFDATSFGIKYGLKHDLDSGALLTAGIGAKKYQGSTHCQDDGCKDISSSGWGMKGSYVLSDGDYVKLNYEHRNFIPEQWHPLSIAPFPLKQTTTLKNDDLRLNGKVKRLKYEAGYSRGEKNDIYSLLIPKNHISFNSASLGFFPQFSLNNHTFNIGPTACFGSIEGSIAEVNLERCLGGKFVTNIGNIELALSYKKYKGYGKKSFTEFNVAENIKDQRLQLDLKSTGWNLSFYYSKNAHTGDFKVFDPTLAFVVGGVSHSNNKTTREYSVAIERALSKQFTLKAAYHVLYVEGQFYVNPKLYEQGKKLELGLVYKF